MAFIPAVTTKGDAGKILTVAGCALYHGAPAFSAMASLRTGADLVTVWTTEEARIGLVQYPSIMAATTEPVAWAPYDALVAGPGLGRSEERWRDLRRAALAVRRDAPIVLDADALYVSEENRRLLQLLTELREARGEEGDGAVLLTPNRRELERLQRATDTTDLASLARHLAYPFILAKGERDVLATPTGRTMTLGGGGGGAPRRCGGLGDLLSGSLGTWLAWTARGRATGRLSVEREGEREEQVVAAVSAAAALVRAASAAAYRRCHRGMLAEDVLADIPSTFVSLWPDEE